MHAAYDNPEVLKLVLTKPYADVNSTTLDGMTALHLAAASSYYNESAKVLLFYGADPLKQNGNGVTPLYLAATYDDNNETFSLLLQKAKGSLNLKDNRGLTPLVVAVENSNRSRVESLLKTGQFVLGDVGMGHLSALDVALETNAGGVMDLILRHGGASISTKNIEKILVRALEDHQQDLKEQTMQMLRDRKPKALVESHALFAIATKTDDVHLTKFLLSFELDPEMRDERDWTLSQMVAAFEPPAGIPSTLDIKHSLPSRWSAVHSSIRAEIFKENGLWLRCSSSPAYTYKEVVTARSDHPISLWQRFYFEINVIKGNGEW